MLHILENIILLVKEKVTLSGISVNHTRFTGYILSGLLAGFGGVLHASRLELLYP